MEAEQSYRNNQARVAADREKAWKRHAKVAKEKVKQHRESLHSPGGLYASGSFTQGGNKIGGGKKFEAGLGTILILALATLPNVGSWRRTGPNRTGWVQIRSIS